MGCRLYLYGVNFRLAKPDIRSNIKKGVRTFVFIDDFLGTGDQFIEFVEHEGLSSIIETNYTAYLPLVAHIHAGLPRGRSQ